MQHARRSMCVRVCVLHGRQMRDGFGNLSARGKEREVEKVREGKHFPISKFNLCWRH